MKRLLIFLVCFCLYTPSGSVQAVQVEAEVITQCLQSIVLVAAIAGPVCDAVETAADSLELDGLADACEEAFGTTGQIQDGAFFRACAQIDAARSALSVRINGDAFLGSGAAADGAAIALDAVGIESEFLEELADGLNEIRNIRLQIQAILAANPIEAQRQNGQLPPIVVEVAQDILIDRLDEIQDILDDLADTANNLI